MEWACLKNALYFENSQKEIVITLNYSNPIGFYINTETFINKFGNPLHFLFWENPDYALGSIYFYHEILCFEYNYWFSINSVTI